MGNSLIVSRINGLLAEKGIPKQKFYKDCGITSASYSLWNTGKTMPRMKNLEVIADYLRTTTDYLLTGLGEKEKAPTQAGERAASAFARIPVLGSIPAGIPIEAIEDILDWEDIPANMCSGGRQYFALQVKGDSMWPDYLPGDVVIVRKSPVCESGDVCVVYVNGYDATLKEVKLSEDGALTVVPHNQSYPPRTYSRQEVKNLPVSIAGVVVELRRKIK